MRGLVTLLVLASLGCQPNPEESVAKIRAFQAEGRIEETIVPLRSLLEDDPDALELNRMFGLALMSSDSPSTAVWALRRVTEHPEHSLDDLFILAQAYGRGGDHDRGLETLERVLEIDPDHEGAHMMRMNLGSRLNRLEDVIESADHVLDLEPGRRHAYRSKAEALLGLERLEEADATLALGRAKSQNRPSAPQPETAYCELEISVAEKLGNNEEVDRRLKSCLAKTKGAIELVDYAVAMYDERGEEAQATSLLEGLVETAPQRFELRARLADRLDHLGRREEALEMLQRATELPGVKLQAWLLVAEFHRERDDHQAAARAVENILIARETVPALMMAEYGDDLLRAGELDKAEEVIGKIERAEWAALLRGRLLLERGEPEAAMEALQEGIRLWPGNGTARLLAARAAEKLGDFDLAILEYRNAIRSDVESTTAAYRLAGLYEAEGRYAGAFFPLNVLLQRKPDDARAGLELIRIALKGQNVALAEDTVKTLRSADQTVTALLGEAMISKATEGPAAAATALTSADLDLTQIPHARVLEALVGYLIDSGETLEAFERASGAAKANPENSDAHALHAKALRELGRDTEAKAAYEQAVAFDPKNAPALAGLATLAAERGDRAEAIEFFDRAVLVDADDSQSAWGAIGLALEAESETAVDERLEGLLYAHPRHAQAAILLAHRLLDRGSDLARADELARRAIRFKAGADAYEASGLVALALGENRRAVQSLRSALELRPESPDILYRLAQALIQTDNLAAAKRALVVALASGEFSNAAAAREELARLEREPGDG